MQPHCQQDDGVLQLLGLVQLAKQLAHALVAAEVGGLAVGEYRNVAARIGTAGPIAPNFDQIEHAANDAVRVGAVQRNAALESW